MRKGQFGWYFLQSTFDFGVAGEFTVNRKLLYFMENKDSIHRFNLQFAPKILKQLRDFACSAPPCAVTEDDPFPIVKTKNGGTFGA